MGLGAEIWSLTTFQTVRRKTSMTAEVIHFKKKQCSVYMNSVTKCSGLNESDEHG